VCFIPSRDLSDLAKSLSCPSKGSYSGIAGMAKASGDPGNNKVVGVNHFIGGKG